MSSVPRVFDEEGVSRRRPNGPHLVDQADRDLFLSAAPFAPSHWSLSRRKRLFDIVFSLCVLAASFLPMLLIAVCIRLSSRGPAIFKQQRVGQWGHMFTIYKFRSMELARGPKGLGLTKLGDLRITWIGRWLRKFKLDELPQFYNVLRGDMSVVGPRPKLPEYAERMTAAYRPGITGAASIAFRREEHILACARPDQVEKIYHGRIKPMKATIDSVYMESATFVTDFRLVLGTVLGRFVPPEIAELEPHDVLRMHDAPMEREFAHL